MDIINQKTTENNLKQDKSKFDYSLELWPIIVGGAIILGVVYLNFYYQYHYNFNIISYLDLSEILISSFVNTGVLDVGLIILALTALTQATPFLFGRSSFLKNNKFKKVLYIIVKHIFYKRKISSKYYKKLLFEGLKLTIIIGVLITIFNLALSYRNKFQKRDLWDSDVLQFESYIFAFTVILAFILYQFKIINYKNVVYAVFVYLISSALLSINERKYVSLSKEHMSFGTKIFTEKDTIISDTTCYYIDKSRNYIFMYNEKNRSITALPMSEVKKLILFNELPQKKPLSKNNSVKKVTMQTINNNLYDTLKKPSK